MSSVGGTPMMSSPYHHHAPVTSPASTNRSDMMSPIVGGNRRPGDSGGFDPSVTVDDVIVLAQQLYCSNQDARRFADEQLVKAGVGNNGQLLVATLKNTNDSQACIYCAQALILWFRGNQKSLSNEDKVDVIGSVYNSSRNLQLSGAASFIVSSVLNAVSKLTKLTFHHETSAVPAMATAALQILESNASSPQEAKFALLALNSLVNEMNLYDNSKSNSYLTFALHRRCSNNFRDTQLLPIFMTSFRYLANASSSPSSTGEIANVTEASRLVKNCLTYDFMAIIVDETEDAMSAQFPASWKDSLMNQELQQTLWLLHKNLSHPHHFALLQAIAAICGTRRSFFDTPDEKVHFLQFTMERLTEIESFSDDRLQNADYCNVLADAALRFVPSYGYKDLQKVPAFNNWLGFMQRFTNNVFSLPFGDQRTFVTTTTLLKFWSRIASSKRLYSSEETENIKDLEIIVPELALTFFRSRINPNGFAEEDVVETIKTQAGLFPAMCVFQQGPLLATMAEHVANIGSQLVQSEPTSQNAAGLAWLLHLTGSTVRANFSSIAEELVDPYSAFLDASVKSADGARRIWNGLGNSEEGLFLEDAMLHFLESVQVTFSSVRQTASVSKVLTNVFTTKAMMFQFFLTSVGHNLSRDITGGDEAIELVRIVKHSINLIYEVCKDMPSSILREVNLSLPPVVQLPIAQSQVTYKLRTNLYSALWSVRAPQDYNNDFLLNFLAPVDELMQASVNTLSNGAGIGSGPAAVDQLFIAGWLRDLRGVTRAVASIQQPFSDFIDWLMERAHIFARLAQNANPPIITISLLRFVIELVTPPTSYGRLHIPSSSHSAAGVLLFKFIAEVMRNVLTCSINDEMVQRVSSGGHVDNAYTFMLKPIFLCMIGMKRCITGDFVPFGAMALYQDSCYDDTVVGMCRLLAVFPLYLFSQYTKATTAVMDLLRAMTDQEVYSPLAAMNEEDILTLVEFALVIASDTETPSGPLLHALSFLQFIAGLIRECKTLMEERQRGAHNMGTPSHSQAASHTGRSMNKSNRHTRARIAEVLVNMPNLWNRLVDVAMNIVTFQDRALSACCEIVFPIFDADTVFWNAYSEKFINNYPVEKQGEAGKALAALGNAATTKEKFFSEIFVFRSTLRKL